MRKESSPFEPVDRPPTPEEAAALDKEIKRLGIEKDLDALAVKGYEKDLDDATKRGENPAMNLWTAREQLRGKLEAGADPKEADNLRAEIEVLNVAIDELQQGESEAARDYFDFDNKIDDLRRSLKGAKDAREASKLEKEIEATRRMKTNLEKFAAVRRNARPPASL